MSFAAIYHAGHEEVITPWAKVMSKTAVRVG